MAFVEGTTATRGALIRLKDTLEFIRRGRDILKMKRDRLAEEMKKFLDQMTRREKANKKLLRAYGDLQSALAAHGHDEVSSFAISVSKMDIEVLPISLMGVVVPKMSVKERPRASSIQSLSLRQVADELQGSIAELLEVTHIEMSIERIAYELMMTNRKVNALEKVIIPAYEKHIRYIENLLFDEDLEEFARIKYINAVADRKKT